MPAESMLSMAKGIGTSPLSPAAHFSPIAMGWMIPELKELWQAGCRHMEKLFTTLQRLIFRRWGVPIRSANELRLEMEQAGFQVLRFVPNPISQFTESRRMVLARRPV